MEVKWYRDKASGKTMERPGWRKLDADIEAGKVAKVVVWRLDRLGRTASGLTTLFDSLRSRGISWYRSRTASTWERRLDA